MEGAGCQLPIPASSGKQNNHRTKTVIYIYHEHDKTTTIQYFLVAVHFLTSTTTTKNQKA